ncbi:uncharacterized protein EI90DRAFT_3154611 [Cantharellus anzutake]|uniref:uncharacterized protein n=1 Tax=Cantharellus anzutake TaxID=1750568 RepID=UPI001904A263|nr:uncharacterized protein EI90DRAFT_3154611 [Cantharellus anzutake]KAF8331365.1 hypothetical protein EI90DRAFT_3154611 [Cantharellus anzutake]
MSEAGSILAAEGVRSHMQILMGVIDRSFIETVTPSKPALAIAAMKNLIVNKSILERGYPGELFGRVLLTLARDRATTFTQKQEVPTISAKVFSTTLLGQDLGLSPNDPQWERFLEKMDTTHINFTHIFQQTEDVDDLSFDLCKAWCLEGLTSHFKRAGPVQLRSLAVEDPAASDIPLELAGPHIEGKKPPLTVVLLMDLGTTSDFGEEIAAALLGALFKEACEGFGRNPDEDVEIQMGASSALRGACFGSVLEVAYRSLTTLPGHLVARRRRNIAEKDLCGIDEWRKRAVPALLLGTGEESGH